MTRLADDRYDKVYDEPDADQVLVIRMTRRQWAHLNDWRAEMPDRYPNRAREHAAAWDAIETAEPDPTIHYTACWDEHDSKHCRQPRGHDGPHTHI